VVGAFILRGLIVGIIAGSLAFGFAKVFGESAVNGAIAFQLCRHQPGVVAKRLKLATEMMPTYKNDKNQREDRRG